MNKVIKKSTSIILSFVLILSLAFGISVPSKASDSTVNIKITVEENYDYAYEVLDILNQERTAEGLDELEMDENLLETAMLRASELVVYYGHTRPNGNTCFTAFPSIYGYRGENIAVGQASAESVMTSWMNSSGHKANILSENYNSAGIGCVKYGNRYYWVQVFSSDNSDTFYQSGTIANTRSIETLTSNISLAFKSIPSTIYEASYPDGYQINMYSANSGWSYVSFEISPDDLTYSFSDESIFTVDDQGLLTVIGTGTADLTVSLKDDSTVSITKSITASHVHNYISSVTEEATCSSEGIRTYTCEKCRDTYTEEISKTEHTYITTVEKASLYQDGSIIKKCSECGYIAETSTIPMIQSVSLSATSYKNTGYEIEPEVTAIDSEGNVISSENYTITYVDNIDVGYATAIVTFKGNYSATVSLQFEIVDNSYIASGVCGDLTWAIDEDYHLYISGTGDMGTYPYTNEYGQFYVSPDWNKYKYTSVTIADTVTSICGYAFYNNFYITEIKIPSSVKQIGNCAFYNCSKLMDVYFEGNVCSIADSNQTFVNRSDSLGDYFTGTFYCSQYSDAYAFAVKYGYDYSIPESECAHIPVATTATLVYCSECGSFLYFIEDALNSGCEHSDTQTINNVTQTCTSKGYTGDTYCNICKKIIVAGSVIYATGHTWEDNYTIDVAPTCETTGSKSIHCVNCNETKSVTTLSALGHNYSAEITKAATCTTEGERIYVCETCGDTYTETIPAAGHTWEDNYTIDIAATCETTGSKSIHCVNCNETKSVTTLSALGHDYSAEVTKAMTCTSEGEITYTCETCGDTYTENIPTTATGHTWEDDYTVDVAATCETTGSKSIHCINCDETTDVTEIPAFGHNYSAKITKAATCTSTGVMTYACTECGDSYTETIAKISHTYKTTTTKATLSKNGSIVTKCSECGTVKSSSTIYYPKTITLSTTSYTYNGKAKKPSVTVKDSNGNKIASSNYTVTYANGRKNVGQYVVKITFKGNYKGTETLYFTIKPKATSISKLTAKSKGFTLKWKKVSSQITGYQIQYSTSKKFTSKTTKTVSKSKTSLTVKKLKTKTKYYVRIRTYKTVNGKKYYSSWSKVKTVTTKK